MIISSAAGTRLRGPRKWQRMRRRSYSPREKLKFFHPPGEHQDQLDNNAARSLFWQRPMQGGWGHYPHLRSASTGGLARSSSLDRTSGRHGERVLAARRNVGSPYTLCLPPYLYLQVGIMNQAGCFASKFLALGRVLWWIRTLHIRLRLPIWRQQASCRGACHQHHGMTARAKHKETCSSSSLPNP